MIRGRLAEETLLDAHIVPRTQTPATVDGTGVDASKYEGVLALVHVGVITGSTLDVKLQESDDNSAWSDIPGAAIVALTVGSKVAAIDVKLHGRPNRKKYVRARSVVTGGTNAIYGVALVLYNGESVPITQTPAAIVV